MGLDRRISPEFLEAGVGYGGSCFPKDVKALAHMASMAGAHPQLLRAVMEINRDMRRLVLQKVRGALGSLEDRTIGVLGLAFKPNTDDLREAPAIEIIHLLQSEGARVKAFDPAANEGARSILPGRGASSDGWTWSACVSRCTIRCWSTAAICMTRRRWWRRVSSICRSVGHNRRRARQSSRDY
jgi:UDPglucose 6-dehydrogenase